MKRLLDKLMILAYTAVLLMVGSLYSKTLSGSTYMVRERTFDAYSHATLTCKNIMGLDIRVQQDLCHVLWVQDEIFHVPQAQKYCQGDWVSWDEKITTFPGVYIVSAILFRIYSVVISPENLNSLQCTADFLRATNILLGIACVPIFHGIMKQVWPWKSARDLVLMVCTIVRSLLIFSCVCVFPGIVHVSS